MSMNQPISDTYGQSNVSLNDQYSPNVIRTGKNFRESKVHFDENEPQQMNAYDPPAEGQYDSGLSTVKANLKDKQKNARPFQGRNITDGRVHISIDDKDREHEYYVYDYKDNPFDVLDQNPVRVTSYMEELKGGNFRQIYNKAVKSLLENNQEQIKPPTAIENLELDLIELIIGSRNFLNKFFLFFQGLTSGLSAIHLYLLYLNDNLQVNLDLYSNLALRLNQIFMICLLICAVGGIDKTIYLMNKYQESTKSQTKNMIDLRKNYIRAIISAVSFCIAYALVVYNHEFIAKLTADYGKINSSNFSNSFSIFQILSILIALASFIGWGSIVTVQADHTSVEFHENISYENLTADDISFPRDQKRIIPFKKSKKGGEEEEDT